jgi:hypothetical protein
MTTLNYSTLTKAQKRYVDSLLKMDPSVAKTGTATRKQILDAHFALVAERKAGEPKVGFPNWLCNVSKVSRGIYAIPLPTATAAKAKKAEKLEESKLKKIIDESDDAFPEVEADYDEEVAAITSSFETQD